VEPNVSLILGLKKTQGKIYEMIKEQVCRYKSSRSTCIGLRKRGIGTAEGRRGLGGRAGVGGKEEKSIFRSKSYTTK